jgi:hypothetical protein
MSASHCQDKTALASHDDVGDLAQECVSDEAATGVCRLLLTCQKPRVWFCCTAATAPIAAAERDTRPRSATSYTCGSRQP